MNNHVPAAGDDDRRFTYQTQDGKTHSVDITTAFDAGRYDPENYVPISIETIKQEVIATPIAANVPI
jgi:hypothetical protein